MSEGFKGIRPSAIDTKSCRMTKAPVRLVGISRSSEVYIINLERATKTKSTHLEVVKTQNLGQKLKI